MSCEESQLESEPCYGYALRVSFGSNLRRLRLQRSLKSGEIAADLRIKQGTYSDYERDRRGLPEGPTLLKFAKYFRVSLDELLEGIDAEYDRVVAEIKAADDLSRQFRDQSSEPSKRGGSGVPSTDSAQARIQQLEAALERQRTFAKTAEDVARRLLVDAIAAEGATTRDLQPRGRRSGRKAG